MKKHRTFTGQERLALVVEGLTGQTSIAEICRRESISMTIWHRWRNRLFENADRVFVKADPGGGSADAAHEAETMRLKSVIAEITEENLALKKTLLPSKTAPAFRKSSGR
jgi:transposase